MTHGGVDGYSRMIVYLKCSVNNQESTVLELFRAAAASFLGRFRGGGGGGGGGGECYGCMIHARTQRNLQEPYDYWELYLQSIDRKNVE